MSSLEQRYRLDVRRMRKHVHHARRDELESMLLHQRARIARERARVARHVHDALCRLAWKIFENGRGAGARRVEQELFVIARRPRRGALVGGEIGRGEFGVADAIRGSVLACARDQSRLAFDTDDTPSAPRNRQREIA